MCVFILSYSNLNSNSNSNSTGAWDTDGCVVKSSSETKVTCGCTHMSNFAVLMEPVEVPLTDWAQIVLRIIYYTGLGISLLLLIWFFVALIISKYVIRLLTNK